MSEASSAFAPLAFMSAAEEYRACAAMCFDLAENQPEQQDQDHRWGCFTELRANPSVPAHPIQPHLGEITTLNHPLLIRLLAGLAGPISMLTLYNQKYPTAVLAGLALAGLSYVTWLAEKK